MRFLLLYLILSAAFAAAQPRLDLKPNDIKFRDIFDRLENVYFINDGDETLIIDSVRYKSSLYFVRYDKYNSYPLTIEPGDSVLMDCILSGHFMVQESDTADTMFVYSNSRDGAEAIKVRIDFFDDDYIGGTIAGKVSSGELPAAGAEVHFFYDGNYLIGSTRTDIYGNYQTVLPPGDYTAAVEADSFNVTFHDLKSDPYSANWIRVGKDSLTTINFNLIKPEYNSNSASGRIIDLKSKAPVRKGVVVIKKGTHTPTKRNSEVSLLNDPDVYTAFIKYDGSYKAENITNKGYYFIQAFSDYYIPAYYTGNSSAEYYWQYADSVDIDGGINSGSIIMPRDSSLGGGIINGTILTGADTDTSGTAIIFARSVTNGLPYSYGMAKENGTYKITNLPYGSYILTAQRIGYPDAESGVITIDSVQNDIQDVTIAFNVSGIEDAEVLMPGEHRLYQNYPNPFNPSTNIEFSLGSSTDAELKVYDVLGRELFTLFSGFLNSGTYRYAFDGSGLTSGLYLIMLKTGKSIHVKRMMLLK